MKARTDAEQVDVVLVGAGIMSATLATLLHQLFPGLTLQAFERLGGVAIESSQVMNNAGTGHAANCELNYTPQKADGTVDVSKALGINEAFEVSLQLWASLVERGLLPEPGRFVNPVPHVAVVWGEDDVRFLRARHAALAAHPSFAGMELSEDRARLNEWMPLVTEGRDASVPLAATRVRRGTDVDFGRLTRALFDGLTSTGALGLHLHHEVRWLQRDPQGGWRVGVRERRTGATRELHAGFVFLGAGGGALPLLQRSGLPEARGYGGFPVSGQWLVCRNDAVIARHHAKVYGKAALGAPPMSVPHLDTRFWNGRRALLFGPFAGFTTKYLKSGSFLDLFASMRTHNLGPMLAVARDNANLTRYLVGQALQPQARRLEALRAYFPGARDEDWTLAIAGQRVQIIKRDATRTGRLEFGTEVVTAADGSLAALLGASPGASTAASAMLDVVRRCFADRLAAPEAQAALQRLIPSTGHRLAAEPEVLATVRERNDALLGLSPET
jgi:malate dehydrogenase (quinone)